MERSARLCAAVALLGLAHADLHAAQVIATWNGGNGSWGSAGNWSGGVVPQNVLGGTTYDVRLDGGKPVASTVSLAASTTIDAITIDSGDRLNLASRSLVVATATVNGLMEVNTGGQYLWNNSGATLLGSGQVIFTGGLFSPNSAGSSARFTNDSTILGYGQMGLILGGGGTGIAFDNNGYLGNSSSAGTLFIRSRTAAVESNNRGTIRASGNGGVLEITHGTIRQIPGGTTSSGAIEAYGDGTGATVWIRAGARIIGGRVDCFGGPGAVVNVEGGAVIERDPTQPVSFINGHSYVGWGTMNLFGGALLNQKTFFVDSGGTLDFKPGATVYTGGNITVDGATARIGQGVLLDGVSLSTSGLLAGTGTIRILNDNPAGAAILRNVSVDSGVSANGAVEIGSTTGFGIADVRGTLTNNGRINLLTPVGSVIASRIALTQDATIAGSGNLVFAPATPALYGRIVGTTGTQTLTNAVGHKIEGAGAIGDVALNDRLRLVNAGTIEASAGTMRLYLNASTHSNTGTIRSRSNLLLGNLADFTFDNAGLIIADGIGTIVQVGGNFGGPGPRGTFTGAGEWVADRGEMTVYGDVNFDTTATLRARNGGVFTYAGTTMNASLLELDGASFVNLTTLSTLSCDLANDGVLAGKPPLVMGQTAGPKLTVNGDVRGSGSFSGNLLLSGSTNAGASAAGSRGLLTFEVLTLGSAHTLVADIAGPLDHDSVVVGGEAVIAGNLQLHPANGFIPSYGASYRILSAGFASGAFSTVGGILIDPLHAFAVTYDAGGVHVTSALPGDVNLDRSVDFDDLLILAQQYGNGTGQTWTTADFTGDGATGFDDLLIFAQRYGSAALERDRLGRDASAAFLGDWRLAASLVPEPALALGLLGGFLSRRRRPMFSHA